MVSASHVYVHRGQLMVLKHCEMLKSSRKKKQQVYIIGHHMTSEGD